MTDRFEDRIRSTIDTPAALPHGVDTIEIGARTRRRRGRLLRAGAGLGVVAMLGVGVAAVLPNGGTRSAVAPAAGGQADFRCRWEPNSPRPPVGPRLAPDQPLDRCRFAFGSDEARVVDLLSADPDVEYVEVVPNPHPLLDVSWPGALLLTFAAGADTDQVAERVARNVLEETGVVLDFSRPSGYPPPPKLPTPGPCPQPPPGDDAAIRATVLKVADPNCSVDERIANAQNGEANRAFFDLVRERLVGFVGPDGWRAETGAVVFDGPDRATVEVYITQDGHRVSDVSASLLVVRDGDRWLVAEDSYCNNGPMFFGATCAQLAELDSTPAPPGDGPPVMAVPAPDVYPLTSDQSSGLASS